MQALMIALKKKDIRRQEWSDGVRKEGNKKRGDKKFSLATQKKRKMTLILLGGNFHHLASPPQRLLCLFWHAMSRTELGSDPIR